MLLSITGRQHASYKFTCNQPDLLISTSIQARSLPSVECSCLQATLFYCPAANSTSFMLRRSAVSCITGCLQIDLDTIETSNLNRQFLFRRSHVGQSKAKVAADVVKSFSPDANITAYQVQYTSATITVSITLQQHMVQEREAPQQRVSPAVVMKHACAVRCAGDTPCRIQ